MGEGKLLWGYYPTTKTWLPLQVDANGKVKVDMSAIGLGALSDVTIASLADGHFLSYFAGLGYWQNRLLAEGDIPASIARDAEVAAAVSAHADLTTGVHGVGVSTVDSVAARDAAIAAITPNSILQKIQTFQGVFWFNNNWLPAGMIKYVVSGGTISWESRRIHMTTGITAGGYCWIGKNGHGLTNAVSWDKKRYLGLLVYFFQSSNVYIHMISGHYANSPITTAENTIRHIGFKILDEHLYGTIANGTTESTLDLGIISLSAYHTLECTLTPGQDCRFYLDGVDKGTITTNLPTGSGTDARRLLYGSIYNTDNIERYWDILEARLLQEE